jgi:GNAT superfamily N-acetyltransferase
MLRVVRIVPVTPDLWPAVATLFAEGGDPKWCSCMYWRVRGLDFSNSTAASNREALGAAVEAAAAAHSPAPGLAALDDDGRAVGWVAVSPRTAYERIERSTRIPSSDERPVWSVVCFVVARRARGRGIAAALLEAAVEHARAGGAPALEAYPADSGGRRLPASAAYTGTLAMFEGAGFVKVADTQSRTGGVPRVVVRRELR